MRKQLAWFLLLAISLSLLTYPVAASELANKNQEYAQSELTDCDRGASIFSWYLHLLNDGAYTAFAPVFEKLNITRVYQQLPIVYLEQQAAADMVRRLSVNGIEVVALIGEKEWGLPGNDLHDAIAYIDALSAYNAGPGADAPIRKLALDVETYTLKAWDRDPRGSFAAYITAMKTIYDYAHNAGLEVVQIIPVFLDSIDSELFRSFAANCLDEMSLMNYVKSTQVSAIQQEIALCRELDIPAETIFETKPSSEKYSVTEKNTFFYDGLSALDEKKNEILNTYQYEKLSVSYHHLTTVYHMVTGAYLTEIYAYTNKDDPTRDDLGQTCALNCITLTGNDGSIITAYLYNPNLKAEYPEICYLACGIKSGVTYTAASTSDDYTVSDPEITFCFEENRLTDTCSLRLYRKTADPVKADGESSSGYSSKSPGSGGDRSINGCDNPGRRGKGRRNNR